MTTVQQAVINVRACVTGMDDGVLPAVIRAERTLLDQYERAISDTAEIVDLDTVLRRQRAELETAVPSLPLQVD